jgi:hypothetical protein
VALHGSLFGHSLKYPPVKLLPGAPVAPKALALDEYQFAQFVASVPASYNGVAAPLHTPLNP